MNYSLRTRLLALASLVLLIGFGLTAWVLNSAYQAGLQASIEDKLQVQILSLLSVAEQHKGQVELPEQLTDSRFNQLSSGLWARVLNAKGVETWRSASGLSYSNISLPTIKPGHKIFKQLILSDGEQYFAAGLGTVWDSAQGDLSYTFYVVENSHSFIQASHRFEYMLWLFLLSIAVALLILQWWLLRWGLAPLRLVSHELRLIETGSQAHITGDYPLELTQLTDSINHLIDSEQHQRQRYKDRMADLAHSLKTPLAILASLEQQQVGREYSELQAQVARMADIVDYQLQRAVLGNQPLTMQKINVAGVIHQIHGALNKVYFQKQVNCQLQLDQQLMFRGDQGDLTELIANLMDNAYKYGAGEVRVTLAKVDNLLQLVIEDNGPGMSQRIFEQVLTRGVRLDTQQAGQGIGMTVVNELIKQYHGTIMVSASDLLGSRIVVNLP